MRVLLDTNIIISRESHKVKNPAIAELYLKLNKIKSTKLVHPATKNELAQYEDKEKRETILLKLNSYEEIIPDEAYDNFFKEKMGKYAQNPNSLIDNSMLYQVYTGITDVFITEDKVIHLKAKELNINNKVFSISSFIRFLNELKPEMIDKSIMSIKTKKFGEINLKDHFFDSFRNDYRDKEFDNWFKSKNGETVYVSQNNQELVGFLYLKQEDENENYSSISPAFFPKKRLKIGTFKVIPKGLRMGERFLQITFENALKQRVDQIYLTIFENREYTKPLISLLEKWGFEKFGYKTNNFSNEKEAVFVKQMKKYDFNKTPIKNFPIVSPNCSYFFLPIYSKYHTNLIPDSYLTNEANAIIYYLDKPYRNALEKVYISAATFTANKAKPGDILLIYRMGEAGERKQYKSVVTTLAIVEDIIFTTSEKKLLKECGNRSVFSVEELKNFWRKGYKVVVKFLYKETLKNKVTLNNLWNLEIVGLYNGPRPFDSISSQNFEKIMLLANK